MKAKCRECGLVQDVTLRRRSDNRHGASITGIACRKCGRHKLRRPKMAY